MDALDQQTQVSISGGMRTTAELECLSPRPATGFHLFVEEGCGIRGSGLPTF